MTTRVPYHVTGSASLRPASSRTAFCDGSGDATFRDGTDVELSHWIPNRTPARYRADTSTEIALRFAEDADAPPVDLVVNNHADVDGVLSVFAATDPASALPHREILIGAAEAGDFWGWTDLPSLALCEGLAVLQERMEGADPGAIYRACIERLPALLADDADQDPDVAPGLLACFEAWDRIESGEIAVRVVSPALATFTVPARVVDGAGDSLFASVPFNAPFARYGALVPHARNRIAPAGLHLVSVERPSGWLHEIWLPGHAWADVVERPLPDGLDEIRGGARVTAMPALRAAVAALAAEEPGDGRWTVAGHVSAFDGLGVRGFPVVAGCIDADGRPAASRIPPDVVAARLIAV